MDEIFGDALLYIILQAKTYFAVYSHSELAVCFVLFSLSVVDWFLTTKCSFFKCSLTLDFYFVFFFLISFFVLHFILFYIQFYLYFIILFNFIILFYGAILIFLFNLFLNRFILLFYFPGFVGLFVLNMDTFVATLI